MDEISRKWRQLLDTKDDKAYTGQWVGFYVVDKEDPVFVLRCGDEFIPECMQKITLTLPLPELCYTVGTHSRCLRGWENPQGEFEGFFHKIKIIHTHRGPKKDGKREEIIFFYGKLATMG